MLTTTNQKPAITPISYLFQISDCSNSKLYFSFEPRGIFKANTQYIH